MTPVVVDASVGYKWLALGEPEEGADAAGALLEDHFEGRIQIRVPALFHIEVGNILVCGRARLPAELIREAIDALYGLPLSVVALDLPLARRTAARARALGLTFYDALYVALAENPSSELVTADRRLAERASERVRVRLLGGAAARRPKR